MDNDCEQVKDQIQELFKARVAACASVNEFALEVEFAKRTKLYAPFKRRESRAINNITNIVTPDLIDLSVQFPVIIFRNAYLPVWINKSSISNLRNATNRLAQDFFHRDVLNNAESHYQASVLFNPDKTSRAAPTYYALKKSVKNALMLLCERSQEFKTTQIDNYGFTLLHNDRKIKGQIDAGFPDNFTEQVYELIAQEEKLSVSWAGNEDVVVMHSNLDPGVLHGRPVRGDYNNPLAVADLWVKM